MWVTGLICVAFLFGSLAQAWSNSQLMQQVQSEQKKLQQIQQQHDQLVQADKYYSDPAVIEKEAREQLGFIRPGEQPVVLVGSNQQAQSATISTSKPAASQGFWQDWWKLFFGE
jgi:cell division protein FtsB